MELPRASYLVCASPRSGTELLCRCLAATGVAGLDRVVILRTAFPDLRVVDVTRRDRVRQAVSWARMAQDGMWVDPVGQPEPAWPPPTGPPRYDYQLIAALEALIAEGEAGCRQLYSELGLTPYQVVYEELSSPAGYEQTVRGVLAHLGLADYQGPIPAPQTRRQSDDLNEAWVAAYLADRTFRRDAPAGERLSATAQLPPADGPAKATGQRAAYIWAEAPVPVIAAIRGNALGGGLQIALGADIRIVAPDARLSVFEVAWGLIPDMTGTQLLPELVGRDVAKELTYTSRIVSGEEAVRIGLATRTDPDPLGAALAMEGDRRPQSARDPGGEAPARPRRANQPGVGFRGGAGGDPRTDREPEPGGGRRGALRKAWPQL